jgi:NAD(P)-dependent dehydrogenase (short-subunit alcohol dehydrogenase family)
VRTAAARLSTAASASYDFTGQVVVVTGGTTGIGAATCAGFVDAGAAAVYNLDAAAGTADGVTHMQCDVSAVADLRRCFDRVTEAHGGRLDVLVANAGIWHCGLVEETTEADFERLRGGNVRGTFFALQNALRPMQTAGRGSIVVICSDQSLIGKPEQNLSEANDRTLTCIVLRVSNVAMPLQVRDDQGRDRPARQVVRRAVRAARHPGQRHCRRHFSVAYGARARHAQRHHAWPWTQALSTRRCRVAPRRASRSGRGWTRRKWWRG